MSGTVRRNMYANRRDWYKDKRAAIQRAMARRDREKEERRALWQFRTKDDEEEVRES